jgi:hypothetical protein
VLPTPGAALKHRPSPTVKRLNPIGSDYSMGGDYFMGTQDFQKLLKKENLHPEFK